MSPFVRREWIEMDSETCELCGNMSPFVRREWIEIFELWRRTRMLRVSLREKGVD